METSTSQSTQNSFSLLPNNKSHLERGIELSLSEHTYAITPPFPDFLDPLNTPINAVPLLALERQVPDWDPLASEEEQRVTTDNQWRVFRKSGTREGIRLAVESLGGKVSIVPWYEYGGVPYSMDVRIELDTPPELENIERSNVRINDAKSERDTYTLTIVNPAQSQGYSGSMIQVKAVIEGAPVIPMEIGDLSSDQEFGSTVQVLTFIEGSPA